MARPVSPLFKALLWFAMAVALIAGAAVLARKPLLGRVLAGAMREAGARDAKFTVTAAAPWAVQIDDLGFKWQEQEFSARRVTIDRARWWRRTLGEVRIEQARLALALPSESPGGAIPVPADVPVERVSFDGVVVAGAPERELTVRFEARQGEAQRWSGWVEAKAEGLALHATGAVDLKDLSGGFRVERWEIDLGRWGGFLQEQVALPSGPWTLGGVASGTATGNFSGGQLAASGRVQWREGHAASEALGVTADGIEADFTFSDLMGLRSAPGTVRVREIRAADLTARAIEVEAAMDGPDRIDVRQARLEALGGRVAAEPFHLAPASGEIAATLLLEGVSVEQVLALAKDVPAKATGVVEGRVPLSYGAQGLQFGRGWLALKPGAPAELQLQAEGLLTGGVAASNPTYSTLKKIEAGLLRLRLTELRLELRPPDGPPGRTATLRVAGEPVEPTVKAPVQLDLNVNGPVEQLLNLGLDQRVKFRGAH